MSLTQRGSAEPGEQEPLSVGYVTVRLPWGSGETFAIDELLRLRSESVDVTIFPLWGREPITNADAATLESITADDGLTSRRVIVGSVRQLARAPRRTIRAVTALIRGSRPGVIAKNLAVVPKGIWLAGELKRRRIQHVHAYWASTPASAAFLASRISGVPMSFTAHRWDIEENNALTAKAQHARWIRAINEAGAEDVRAILPMRLHERVRVMHLGIHVPKPRAHRSSDHGDGSLSIVVPANLVPKKGHAFLIEALSTPVLSRHRFRVTLLGDGPMRGELEILVRDRGLEDRITFAGSVPHDDVLRRYLDGKVDLVVLPSVTTPDGQHEGIPISLVEAMAHGIPVIATANGGIPELLHGGCGIQVPERDPEALAQAILSVVEDPALAKDVGARGWARVDEQFNIDNSVGALISSFDPGMATAEAQ